MTNRNSKNTCRTCGESLEYYENVICTPCIDVQHKVDEEIDDGE
jgi:hypothetical protein